MHKEFQNLLAFRNAVLLSTDYRTCSSKDSRSGPSSPAHTARRMSSGPRRKLENWVSMMLMLLARDSGMSDTAPSGFLLAAAAST